MGIYRGTATVDAVYRGTATVDAVYRGTALVWSPESPPPVDTYDLQNTFAGGSDGVTITPANSGGASGDPWNEVSGTPQYDTGDVPPGSTVASLHPATGYCYLSWTSLSGRKAAIRFWFKPTAAPGTDQRLLRINSTGDNWGLLYRTGGLVRLMIGSSGVNGEDLPVNVNEWNEVVLTVDGDTKAYTMATFAADGTELGSRTGTGAHVAGDFDYLRLGGQLSSADFGGPYSIGDVRFNLDDVLAPPAKPDASNTGHNPDLLDGTLTGSQYIDTPGTLIENKTINGKVIVRADNVTIRNCVITGGSSDQIVEFRELGGLIEYCTIYPADQDAYIFNGVRGSGFTARHNDISKCCDGFSLYNPDNGTTLNDVLVESNWVHDMYFSPDAGQGDGNSHNDGVQVHGPGVATIRYNNFEMFPSPDLTNTHPYGTSGFIITDGAGPTTSQHDIYITGNWFAGDVGAWVNIASNTTPTTVYLNDNIFHDDTSDISGEGVIVNSTANISVPGLPASSGPDTNNGNVYASNGQPVFIDRRNP